MEHKDKIAWLHEWCDRNGVYLDLQGEVGFGRECVGITDGNAYVDYDYDSPAAIHAPSNAYHKHDCLAVLGRGQEAEAALFEWIKTIDAHLGVVEEVKNELWDGSYLNAIIHKPTVKKVVF